MESNIFSLFFWKMNDPKYKQRVVIQFLVKSGEKPSEILRKLELVYGRDECMSKTRVFEWAKRFKEGRESLDDDPREGAPVTSCTAANVDRLRALITSDRHLNIRALSAQLNINKESVRKMLHDNLNMRKIGAKMVPKLLTHEQKHMRKSICEDLLSRIRSDGIDWMSRVVTGGDENWIVDPDESQQWVEQGGERLRVILFFDIHGIVHREYVPAGQTVTGQYYVDVLERLRVRISSVRPELTIGGWILHHDNAPPAHSSLVAHEFLAKNSIPTLPHPSYSSPDIVPCDFFLFPKVKSHLIKATQHGGIEELKEAVTTALKALTLDDYRGCFQSWEHRWSRCVELEGDYCDG